MRPAQRFRRVGHMTCAHCRTVASTHEALEVSWLRTAQPALLSALSPPLTRGPSPHVTRFLMPSKVTSDYIRTTIDRSQGRSMVMSASGIAASEHPLASQAGASVLARGGHAVDAAIAVNAVMGVVAPMMNGVGGDLFAIVYDAATGELHGVNGSGCAPAALTIAALRAGGITSMPQTGINSVTIPGAVAGMVDAERAVRPAALGDVLAPAIRIAERAFRSPRSPRQNGQGRRPCCGPTRSAARIYLPGGPAPRVGQIFRNPDLAATFARSPQRAATRFYRGDDRAPHSELLRSQGGVLTAADLAEYSAEWVTPLSTTYHGWTVYELPPNGQGIAALMMLNLLEQSPIGSYGHNSVEALHTLIEAKKLAYADMARHVCDPALSSGARGDAAVEGVCRASAPARSTRRAPTPRSRRARCRRMAATRRI